MNQSQRELNTRIQKLEVCLLMLINACRKSDTIPEYTLDTIEAIITKEANSTEGG